MLSNLRTADFEFELSPELIAQSPAPQRDQSRLLVLYRPGSTIEHRSFRDLPEYLQPGDALVLNDSRVIPARLHGVNAKTGGEFEILLLEENGPNDWWSMVRPGRRARAGTEIMIQTATGTDSDTSAVVLSINEEGHRRLKFSGEGNLRNRLSVLGEVPLPPYITRARGADLQPDLKRYQTVYADPAGSVAAPTAGLHFTGSLLERLRSRKVKICFLTLHVGLGTFAPVKSESLEAHQMHEEFYQLNAAAAKTITEAKLAGKRIIAVGTTTVRVLESIAAENNGSLVAGCGKTRIFIYPPYDFKIVDALLTNFHLPRSTLLMLVSAFAAPKQIHGRDIILAAYREAIREKYRFFSYGDAMLVL